MYFSSGYEPRYFENQHDNKFYFYFFHFTCSPENVGPYLDPSSYLCKLAGVFFLVTWRCATSRRHPPIFAPVLRSSVSALPLALHQAVEADWGVSHPTSLLLFSFLPRCVVPRGYTKRTLRARRRTTREEGEEQQRGGVRHTSISFDGLVECERKRRDAWA